MVVPIHSMAGVGFPDTVQRNSARWPCWTFSTEGLMVATGWAPSAATDGDTPVKHSPKRKARLPTGTWRNKVCCSEVEYETMSGVYNHSLGIVLCCGKAFDYNELIRLRERERVMASARAPTLTLGSLDPQSRRNRWDVAGRPWHGLWAYCCLRQFGWLLDFVFNPVWSQGDRAIERPLSVGREEYEAI